MLKTADRFWINDRLFIIVPDRAARIEIEHSKETFQFLLICTAEDERKIVDELLKRDDISVVGIEDFEEILMRIDRHNKIRQHRAKVGTKQLAAFGTKEPAVLEEQSLDLFFRDCANQIDSMKRIKKEYNNKNTNSGPLVWGF